MACVGVASGIATAGVYRSHVALVLDGAGSEKSLEVCRSAFGPCGLYREKVSALAYRFAVDFGEAEVVADGGGDSPSVDFK